MAKKATRKSKGQKNTPSKRKAGAGRRAAARSGRNTGRKTAGAKTPKGKARRKQARNPPRPGKAAKAGKRPSAKSRRAAPKPRPKAKVRRSGGTGRESTLDQTPETGRSVQGRTNPMPTRR